jgi:hypothetical protein
MRVPEHGEKYPAGKGSDVTIQGLIKSCEGRTHFEKGPSFFPIGSPEPVAEMILVQNWHEKLKRLAPTGKKECGPSRYLFITGLPTSNPLFGFPKRHARKLHFQWNAPVTEIKSPTLPRSLSVSRPRKADVKDIFSSPGRGRHFLNPPHLAAAGCRTPADPATSSGISHARCA